MSALQPLPNNNAFNNYILQAAGALKRAVTSEGEDQIFAIQDAFQNLVFAEKLMPKVTLEKKEVLLKEKAAQLKKLTSQLQAPRQGPISQKDVWFIPEQIGPLEKFLSITDDIDDQFTIINKVLESKKADAIDKQKASNALDKISTNLQEAKRTLQLIPDNYHETTMHNAYVKEYSKVKTQFFLFRMFRIFN